MSRSGWMKRIALGTLVALVLLTVAAQFLPFGRAHANPPVTAEPDWDRPETRELFMEACGDCHSHETEWPWYSHVAPASWIVEHDVAEGRDHLNVSRWGQGRQEAGEAVELLREGRMPLWYYLPLHAEARLSAEEEAQLIRGLEATFRAEGAQEGEGGQAG